jgi:two-component system CheB/CheR fusion protein
MKPKPERKPVKSRSNFLIVGIGASAGGLHSLECFLSALSRKFNFALVFMQHLSATHKSLLPELLRSHHPHVRIEEITAGLKIEAGKLYLCPPAKETRLENRVFALKSFARQHVHLPIDEFFISLAEDAEDNAIGVIFSGAGTDGARGIQMIKTMGGTAFVQQPGTAEFTSMPLAAIATGQADNILPPDEIAREIIKLLENRAVSARPGELLTPAQLEIFYQLLFAGTGIRFNHYKTSVVGRRIRRRMSLRGIQSVADYARYIADSASEANQIALDLMIGITSFFRDRVAWKALTISVVRQLVAEESEAPIRVWTPACATGEEPYSIAMLICHELDLAGKKREVHVFATDINEKVIEKARQGTYPASVAADIPPEYIDKFFSVSADELTVSISQHIRECIVFAKQDLLTDPPFSRLDLIICRNLLIYLEPEAQEKCIALFNYALNTGGYLFLGNAESIGTAGKLLFKTIGHKKCRIYQKAETGPSAKGTMSVPFAAERATTSSVTKQQAVQQIHEATVIAQEALLEEYTPAAIAIDQNYTILYHNGPTNKYLRQPRGVPTRNLLELLPENLRSRLRGAIYRANKEMRPVSVRLSGEDGDDLKRPVTLRFSKLGPNLYLAVFREKGGISEQTGTMNLEASAAEETAIRQLESELLATRHDLQNHNEQLKGLNEELQSSNEELQAANEELETSREELQSLNEELVTVNSQLQTKIEDEEEINNDLNNFLTSTNIPTIFLDRQFRVKRFTPAMINLIKLIPTDVGRPIVDMSRENLGPDLIPEAEAVLEKLSPVKRELKINDAWYMRVTLPYRTFDDRIGGVVITFTEISELKRADEELRRQAELLRLSYDAVIVWRLYGGIESWNRGAEQLYGFTEDEVLGKTTHKLLATVHPEPWEQIETDLREKSLWEGELRHHTKDGREVVVSARKQLIRGDDGVDRVLEINRDITGRKKAEEALRESRDRLDLALHSSRMATFDWDIVNNKRTWSDGVHELLGTNPETFTGEAEEFFEVIHPEDRGTVQAALARSVEITGELETEYRAVWPDGTIRHIAARGKVHRNKAGQAVMMTGVCWDITERKKAEEAVSKSESRYRELVQNANSVIIRWKRDGTLTFFNEFAQKFFGYGEEEIIGSNVSILVPERDSKGVDLPKLLREIVENPERFANNVNENVLRDGRKVWMAWTNKPIFDEQGQVVEILAVGTDITERKLAEDALRANNDELERLNRAMVGRELRMVELKKEVNELCVKAGLQPPYKLDFEEEPI